MVELPTGTVTFLFTDVEQSTRLLAQLGSAEYGRVLEEHRTRLRTVFSRGREVDEQGDSLFYAFARADDAVAAAAAGQRALEGLPVRVRMGVRENRPSSATVTSAWTSTGPRASVAQLTAARCCFPRRPVISPRQTRATSASTASRT
jgi:class 3 adenylate cyclase